MEEVTFPIGLGVIYYIRIIMVILIDKEKNLVRRSTWEEY